MEKDIAKISTPEDKHRKLSRFWWWVLVAFSGLGILLALNQVFTLRILGFMPVENAYSYYLIALFLPLVYILVPATKTASRDKVPWYDCLLFLLCVVAAVYFAANAMNILQRGWELRAPITAAVFSVLIWVLVVEALRRAGGLVLASIVAVFSIYPLFAGQMPGIFEGFSYSFLGTAAYHAMSQESILGIPLRTVGTLIIGFMVFGVALQYTGAGKFMIDFSMALLGHLKGGPAKVAVVSSALFGSMSGSPISNVLSTGPFTIPTMKRVGYAKEYAGAVEAVASTGGIIMPPVMGAVAFIMAAFLSVPYSAVIIAAIVPAVLYYVGLFTQVDGYARKEQLKGVPRAELPSVRASLKAGWFYIVAFFALVFFLLYLRREAAAPFYATALLLALAMIRKDTRFTPRSFLEFLAGIGKFLAELTAVLAGVGLIIGSLSMTGIVPVLTGELLLLAGGSVIVLLLLGSVASAIMGMGMTASACYIFLAIMLAPALVTGGVEPMAAHLFILYWGIISCLTPPVALSAITAANIAQSSPMKTGFLSMRLGIAIYFVPFLFVLNPSLLLIGPASEIIPSVLTAIAGMIVLGYGLSGYLPRVGNLSLVMRIIAISSGVLLTIPHWYPSLAGLLLLIVLALVGLRRYRVEKRVTAEASTITGQEE